MPAQMIHFTQEAVHNYDIEEIWLLIPSLTIIDVLSRIENHLLVLLLELSNEFNSDHHFTIMSSQNKVDEILNRTIGHIHAKNASFNGNNYQSKGDNNTVAQGAQVTQNVASTSDLKQKVKELTSELNKLFETIGNLSPEDKADISHEIQAMNVQIARPEPKFSIVGKSLQIIESILINVAPSAYTSIILERIQSVLSQLPQ